VSKTHYAFYLIMNEETLFNPLLGTTHDERDSLTDKSPIADEIDDDDQKTLIVSFCTMAMSVPALIGA